MTGAGMATTFLIKFDVIPEQRARFLSLLEGVLDAMRDEPCSMKRFCTAIRSRSIALCSMRLGRILTTS